MTLGLMTCPRCGVRNTPQVEECASCGQTLQSGEAAQRNSEQWDKLEPALQNHLRDAQRESMEVRQRWLQNIREKRTLHAVLGSLLFGIAMTIVYVCWWQGPMWALGMICLLPFLSGGWAGYRINAVGGGQRRGALIFGGTYLAIFAVSWPLGLFVFETDGSYVHFTLRAFFTGAVVSLLLGLSFGRYLDQDRRGD